MDSDQSPDAMIGPRHAGQRIPLGQALARQWRRWGESLHDPRPEMHNERMLFLEIMFQAVSTAGAMSFVSVFLVRLGAPNWLVGLDSSLPALMTILCILPAGVFVSRQRSLIKVANWSRLVWRLLVGSFALLPWLSARVAPYLLVAARTLTAIPGSTLSVASTTIVGQATTPRRRPRMLSMRMALHGLVGAGTGLLAGLWLDGAAYPLNYQLLFVSALLVGLGNIYCLSRLKLSHEHAPSPERRRSASLGAVFALIKATPAFRNFTLAELVFRLGLAVPAALYAIFRVREMGCSDAWIGILLTAERLLSVGVYFALGRLLSRPKVRKWLWLSCIGAAFYPLTMALCTTPAMLLIPAAMGGLFGSGMEIFMTNTLFEVSPVNERPTFIAANTLVANITAFVGPMLGTTLTDALDIRMALLIAAAIRIVGALAFWLMGVARATASSMDAADAS